MQQKTGREKNICNVPKTKGSAVWGATGEVGSLGFGDRVPSDEGVRRVGGMGTDRAFFLRKKILL